MLLRTLPLLNEFDHLVIALKNRGELANQMEKNGIKIISLNQKYFFDICFYSRLCKELKKYNPNLIITYLFHADVIGRLFIQLVSKTQVIPFLRTTYNHKKYWFPRLFGKFTKSLVKNYLANSESVKDFYIEKIGVPGNRIAVVPNGIDTTYFDNISRNENLRQKLEIEPEEIVIVCVANFYITAVGFQLFHY